MGHIYARFGKKMSDVSQLIFSLTLVGFKWGTSTWVWVMTSFNPLSWNAYSNWKNKNKDQLVLEPCQILNKILIWTLFWNKIGDFSRFGNFINFFNFQIHFSKFIFLIKNESNYIEINYLKRISKWNNDIYH